MKTGYKSTAKPKSKAVAVKGYTSESIDDYKPTFTLTTKDLPDIADWKVGETYEINLKVKQVSLSQDNYDGQNKTRASFEIQSASTGEDE